MKEDRGFVNVIRDNVKVYFFNPEGKRIQVNKYTVHNLTGFIPAGEIKKTLLRYRYFAKTEKYLSQYLYLKSVYRIMKVNRRQSSLIIKNHIFTINSLLILTSML